MKNSYFNTLLLSLLPGFTVQRYWQWLDHFVLPENVLTASPALIPKLTQEGQQTLAEYQRLADRSRLHHQADAIIDQLNTLQAQVISHNCEAYPELLREIHRAPPLLFVKGNVNLLSMPQIAIVGTRHPTHGGQENTQQFSRFLAKQGFTITSGLALGVDSIAHQSALAVEGSTIAVMATGIDSVYPRQHAQLAQDILQNHGLLVTEFPLGTAPQRSHFPQRNRLISGLSVGTLVIEAAIKSGSLITARFAAEQNREVFSIPGSIHNPQSKGCHALIKQGAQLVESADDIVEQLGGLLAGFHQAVTLDKEAVLNQGAPGLTPVEKQALDTLGYEPALIDQLIQRSELVIDELMAALITLEIKGLVKQSVWGYEKVPD